MILPKITYDSHRLDTFNGTDIIAITLRNSSQGADSAITGEWSITTGVGNVSYSSTADELFTVFCDMDSVFTTLVTLTLSGGQYTTMRLVGNIVGAMYVGLALDVFILPGNNDQFTVASYQEALVGSISATYTLFNFDSTSDSIIEDSSSTPTTFSYTYRTSNTPTTATITASTNIGSLTSQIGVELSNGVSELEVESVDECKALEVWSQTEDYIEKLIGRGDIDNSDMSYLGVDVMLNCCETDVRSFKLAPIYDFTLTNSDCHREEFGTIVTIGGYDYQLWEATITLGGIDLSLISTLEFSGSNRNQPTILIVNTNTPKNQFTIQYLLPDTDPGAPVISETYLLRVTTVAGFVYNMEYTATPSFLVSCTIDFSFNDIEYPENPCYVTITEDVDRTYLTIDNQLYVGCVDDADTLEAMVDGVYQVTLSDSGISNESVTGCDFVNCETRCLVVEALSKECDPIIAIIYDALVDAQVCDNVTCQNLCDLYEMLQAMLKACDCTSFVNNKVEKKPCKTCKGGW